MDDATIRAEILAQCQARGAKSSICPSEVARALAPDWRALMPDIRRVAADLAEAGEIVVTQKGRTIDAHSARGPIRLTCARPSTSA